MAHRWITPPSSCLVALAVLLLMFPYTHCSQVSVVSTGNGKKVCNGFSWLFGDQQKTWQEARDYCESKGYYLAAPADLASYQCLLGLPILRWQFCWLGITDQRQEGVFEFAHNNIPASPLYWANGQPDNYRDDDCVLIRSYTLQYADVRCDSVAGYVCQKVGEDGEWGAWSQWGTCTSSCGVNGWRVRTRQCDSPPPSSGGRDCEGYNRMQDLCAPPRCPTDKEVVCGGHTWLYGDQKLTWDQARKYCKNRGYYLAAPETEASYQCMAKLPAAPNKSRWIGISDYWLENYFRMEKNGNKAVLLPWSFRQPDNAGNEDCVMLLWNDHRYADRHCGDRVGFVCQKSAINGVWSSWSAWSECSALCGFRGRKNRTRLCNSPPPAGGGLDCPGPARTEVSCRHPRCPVHGNWGSWTAWGDCRLVCGCLQKVRTRQCTNPTAVFGGRPCRGMGNQRTPCHGGTCQSDLCPAGWVRGCNKCYFIISHSGLGYSEARIRCQRKAMDSQLLAVLSREEQQDFESSILWQNLWVWNDITDVGNESRWTHNSVPITYSHWYRNEPNGGPHENCVSIRRRQFEGHWVDTHCNFPLQAVCERGLARHGGHSAWGEWSVCSVTGGGQCERFRMRQCNNPTPAYEGLGCMGLMRQSESCAMSQCELNMPGRWAVWGAWNQCSSSCGCGQRFRARRCTLSGMGSAAGRCHGDNVQRRSCRIRPCSGEECPSGWITGCFKCYRVYYHPLRTYHQARSNCSGLLFGSRLLSALSSLHQLDLESFVLSSHIWAWLDITDSDEEGRWAHSNVTTFYSNWRKGSPDGGRQENCAAVSTADDGRWTDEMCDHQFQTVCERDLGTVKAGPSHSPWGDWTACSVTCGPGVRVRRRQCTNLSPNLQGAYCSDPNEESEPCTSNTPCPAINCGRPEALENGWEILSGTTAQHSQVIGCHPPFFLTGGYTHIRRVCMESGAWLPATLPECKALQCKAPSTTQHLVTDYLEVDNKSAAIAEVRQSCPPGFIISQDGDRERSCDAVCQLKLVSRHFFRLCQPTSVRWSGSPPTCSPLSCQHLTAPSNGKMTSSPGQEDLFHVGVNKTFSCNPGFILHGDESRQCQSNREWPGQAAQCIKDTSCPPTSCTGQADVRCTLRGIRPSAACSAEGKRNTDVCLVARIKKDVQPNCTAQNGEYIITLRVREELHKHAERCRFLPGVTAPGPAGRYDVAMALKFENNCPCPVPESGVTYLITARCNPQTGQLESHVLSLFREQTDRLQGNLLSQCGWRSAG